MNACACGWENRASRRSCRLQEPAEVVATEHACGAPQSDFAVCNFGARCFSIRKAGERLLPRQHLQWVGWLASNRGLAKIECLEQPCRALVSVLSDLGAVERVPARPQSSIDQARAITADAGLQVELSEVM